MSYFGIACVKNEADIIEAFVRHNLAHLDRLILLDHGSTDRTPEILRALQDEGLPLDVERDASLGKFQGEKMTRLLRQAATAGADWIMLLDGDEFIQAGQARLPEPPAGSPGVLKLAWRTYCCRNDDPQNEPIVPLRIRHRLVNEPLEHAGLHERRYYLKALVHRTIALDPRATALQGNHQIFVDGVEPTHAFWDGFELAHYPLRSPGQYGAKIAIHILQHWSKGSTQEPFDWFYLPHFEKIRGDFTAFSENFHQLLPAYIETRNHPHDTILAPLTYRGGPLRYHTQLPESSVLIGNLLFHAEALARSHGQLNPGGNEALMTPVKITVEHARGSASVTAHLRADLEETIRVPVAQWNPADRLTLAFGGPVCLIQCARITLIAQDGMTHVWPGPLIEKDWEILGNLHPVRDGQHFAFIKGMARAEMALPTQSAVVPDKIVTMELRLRADAHPATLGLRYFQQDPFFGEARQLEIINRLEARLGKLVTVKGWLLYQAGYIFHHLLPRLWRRLR